jgi:hypothetical protein
LLAERLGAGLRKVIAERRLPWHVVEIGSRLDWRYSPHPPRNAREAFAVADAELDAFLHLLLVNRGVPLTPFHNMALISPVTEEVHVDRHVEVFADSTREVGDARQQNEDDTEYQQLEERRNRSSHASRREHRHRLATGGLVATFNASVDKRSGGDCKRDE